jgi:hypothetical protein
MFGTKLNPDQVKSILHFMGFDYMQEQINAERHNYHNGDLHRWVGVLEGGEYTIEPEADGFKMYLEVHYLFMEALHNGEEKHVNSRKLVQKYERKILFSKALSLSKAA